MNNPASPIAGIVDNVVREIVKPIVGTVDELLEDLDDAVEGVADILDPVLENVVSPVLEGAGGLLEGLLSIAGAEALDAVLADMGLDPIQPLGDLTDSVNDTLQSTLGLPGNLLETVVPTAGNALQGIFVSASEATDGVIGGSTSALGLSSGGSLEFTSSTADLPHYEIMSGGTYTEYGLTLQKSHSATMGPTSLVDTASDLVSGLLGAVADEPLAPTANTAPLASALEETRGAFDGLGL